MAWDPTTIDLKIKINAVDVTAYVPRTKDRYSRLPGITITGVMGKAIDICTLSLKDASALTIKEWHEIVITNDAENVYYFGGFITNIRTMLEGPIYHLILRCSDYTIAFDKSIINQEWDDIADTTILANIRSNADPDLTAFDFSTYVTGQDDTSLRAPRKTALDTINELAKRVGADWYVDYEKNLHFFGAIENAAAFDLSDTPDYAGTFPYDLLDFESDGMGIVNRLTVVGSTYLSGDITHEYEANNQQVRFVLPHAYHAQVAESGMLIDKNTGTDESPVWTAQDVGVKYIDDEGSDDVLFAFQEKFVEFAVAPANLTKAWRVKARYEVPLRVRVRSQGSYDEFGVWLEDVLIDDTIKDKVSARARGQAELAEKALGRIRRKVIVYEPGLRQGETIRLVNSVLNEDTTYLIRKMKRKFLGGGYIADQLDLGAYLPDLHDLLVDLARKAVGAAVWRDDEVLDELLEHYETLTLTESSLTATSTAAPYRYAPSGSGEFNYGFGVYG